MNLRSVLFRYGHDSLGNDESLSAIIRIHMRVELCTHMCVDMCTDMSIDMCIDMCVSYTLGSLSNDELFHVAEHWRLPGVKKKAFSCRRTKSFFKSQNKKLFHVAEHWRLPGVKQKGERIIKRADTLTCDSIHKSRT